MSDVVERAREMIDDIEAGRGLPEVTPVVRDLLDVIADLRAEVKQLEGEVFAWRMRNHKLADEVKAALATLAEVREVVHRVGDFAIKDVDGIVAIAAILDRGPR